MLLTNIKKHTRYFLLVCCLAVCGLVTQSSFAASLDGSASGTNLTNPSKLPYLLSSQARHPPCFDDVLTWHRGVIDGSLYVKDYSRGVVSYPFVMVDGPSLTFNGVDEYGSTARQDLGDTIVFSCEFELYSAVQAAGLYSQGYRDFKISIRGGVNTNEVVVGWGLGSGLDFYQVNLDAGIPLDDGVARKIKVVLDRARGECSLYIDNILKDSGSNTGVTGVVVHSATGTMGLDAGIYTDGKFWNICINDRCFPCIGKTDTVNPTSTFATDGTEMTITSSDYAAVWAGTQNTYFYEAHYGYWEDVSGRYPYAHSGATFHAGNQWNYSMNGYKFADPVPAAIIAMDTDGFFINDLDEALTFQQQTIEELGAELQPNNHFTTNLAGYSVTTNWAWESPGVARHTTGSVVALTSAITLTDAVEYEITFTAGGATAGTVTPYAGSGATGTARGNGIFTERLTCTTSTDFLLTPTTDFDGWVDNVSVRAVVPLVNNNDKYMFGSIAPSTETLWCYSEVQTGECLRKALFSAGGAAWLVRDGVQIVRDGKKLWRRL